MKNQVSNIFPRKNSLLTIAILILAFSLQTCVQKDSANNTEIEVSLSEYQDGLAAVNGTELYYKIIGEGEPLIVVHAGPGMDHNHLYPNIGKLAREFQVIFYDQRGTGHSSAEIDSLDINTSTFVEDLEALRTKFGIDNLNLLGVSWGAMLAMQYAIAYPDHLNALILGCPMGASSDFTHPFSEAIQQARTSEDSLALVKIRQSDAFKNGDPEAADAASKISFKSYFHPGKQHLADQVDYNYGESTMKNRQMVSSLIFQEYQNYDIHDELSNITSPTLVIHGDSDPLPWEFAERIHSAIPNSQFELLKDTGHFIFVEAEEEFLDIVTNFINDHI